MNGRIRNADIPALRRVLPIMREVENKENMMEWQRERLMNATKRITGMPGGGGGPSSLDEPYARLSELANENEAQIREYMDSLKKAEEILNTIPCDYLKTFVQLKYVMRVPRAEIMRDLNLTEWTYRNLSHAVEDAPDMAHTIWSDTPE